MKHLFYLKDGTQALLRNIEKNDAKKVLEYLCIVGGETDFLLFDEHGLDLTIKQEEMILDQISKHPVALMIGCFIGEDIVAISNLSIKDRARIQHIAALGISVKKVYWNQKIGTEMLKFLIDYSIENKQIKMIHLEVRSDNLRAIKVYQNMGFESVGMIKKAVKIDDKYYSNLLMIRDVS